MNNCVNKNPFKGYQQRKQIGREQIIREYLKKSKSARLKFDDVTQLAEMAAAHVAEVERAKKPCNASTLLRNERYRVLLDDYLKTKKQGGLELIHGDTGLNSVDKLVSFDAQLELGNLRLENERMKRYLGSIGSETLSGQSKLVTSKVDENDESLNKIKRLECDLGSTCKALDLVLKHFPFYVRLDANSGELIDPEPPAGKSGVIVEKNFVYAYMDWLKINERRSGGN